MGSYIEISLQARKFAIMSMKGCFRSVKRHPFLVGLVLFLIFLYRSFPLLFSLLLSASPVLVCTAVLLGTLLSFGQSNLPEIETDEVFTRDSVSLGLKASRNNETFVVERDSGFVVERYVGDRRDLADDTRSVDVVDSLDRVPLINENSREGHVERLERGILNFEFGKKREILEKEVRIEEGALSDGKIVENHYSLVRDVESDKNLEAEVEEIHKKPVGDCEEDHVESSRVAGGDENEIDTDKDDDDEDEDGLSGSDSDRAESSSPDASMADIIPMLDELHPLLDLDAPQPPHMSHGESESESDSASEHSHGSGESDDETGNQGDDAEEDDGGEDEHEDDDEDEEEVHEGKEDDSKSAIKWTEDDQKNLMDLGTSEIERNQRLENLIARRRARKSFRLMPEKNLIDLDSADLPFNVPQISTARRNPFDLPDDSYDHLGLPPIPGSAPSILLPRRNPFDLPYDSSEEKPDLKGDNFEHEFLPPQQREMMFRRHESFILGPSGLGASSRSEARWRPVFVPERYASEGTSFSLFQRQSSEVSESKLSSVLDDTDSVGSVGDADEKKLSDRDFSREDEVHSETYEGSDVAEHGSQSSKDEDDSIGRDINRDEIEITLGDVESQHDTELDSSESHLEHNAGGDIHLEAKRVDDGDSNRSSVSSFSDQVDDRIPDVKRGEHHVELGGGVAHLEKGVEEEGDSVRSSLSTSSKISDSKNEDSSPSLVAGDDSLDDSNFRFVSGVVDDHEHKEPVYDSSPHAADRLISLTSISFDTQPETTELLNPPASVQVTESRDLSISNVASSEVHAVPEEVTESRDVSISSEVCPKSNNRCESVVHESESVRDDIVDLGSISLEAKSLEESKENKEENSPNKHDHETHKTVNEHEEAATLHGQISSTSFPTVVDRAPVFSSLATCKSEPFEFWEIVRQEMIHTDEHRVLSASSSETMSVEDEMFRDELVHPEKEEDPISGFESEIQVESYRDLGVQLEFPDSSHHTISDESSSSMVAHVSEENDRAIELPTDNHESVQLEEPMQIHPEEVPVEEKSSTEVEREKDSDLMVLSSSSNHESPFQLENDQDSDLKVASSSFDIESLSLEEKSSSLLEKEKDPDLKIGASTSEGKFPFKLDKGLSIPNESLVEPCDTRDVELDELATVTEQARGVSGISVDARDRDVKVLATLPTDNSDSTIFPSGSFEYKPLAGEIDLNDSILNRTVDDDDDDDDNETRFSGHHAEYAHENIKEEADEISDIDEDLLSELDAVGDFGTKEVGDSEKIPEALPSSASSIPMEVSKELLILEARSFENIDLAFKQPHEGVNVEEVVPPGTVKAPLDGEESKSPREMEIASSDSQVVEEAKSLEDVEVVQKKVSDDDVDVGVLGLESESPISTSKKESAEVDVSGVDSVITDLAVNEQTTNSVKH